MHSQDVTDSDDRSQRNAIAAQAAPSLIARVAKESLAPVPADEYSVAEAVAGCEAAPEIKAIAGERGLTREARRCSCPIAVARRARSGPQITAPL
jgi:hypothetical protein